MTKFRSLRAELLAGAVVGMAGFAASPALAQKAGDVNGLEEIIVTAQKREQNVQDVPVAVTALTRETMLANRVTSVETLSSLAPGFTVRQPIGGARLPSFAMRGAVSFGVAPGSDKQISTYVDGVYLSAGRGGIFDLPDLQSIEILRGPQGTLFGRNATAGAVSIRTRDPDGKLGFKVTGTVGNQGQYGLKLGVDFPQVGPFSGYVSYVRSYRRGDVRNVGVPQTWDRTSSALALNRKVETTAKYLGTQDSNSIFAALKFESGDFTTVYKFDWNTDNYSPQAIVASAINAAFPGVGAFLNTLVNSQTTPVVLTPDGKRPDTANNSWTTQGKVRAWGHNLTSNFVVSDRFSVKNIFAIRKTVNYSASPIDGFSGLPITAAAAPLLVLPASFVGQPFVATGTQIDFSGKQYSDELQANYKSALITAVVGGLWFKVEDNEGQSLLQPSVQFSPLVNGVIPNKNIGRFHNDGKSLAGYGQVEVHITPQLDAVLGGRVTRDEKEGYLDSGTTIANIVRIPFERNGTKFTYLLGTNYRPTDDIMLYGKYSTAYVSGGSVAGIPFEPETVRSFEIGAKTEFFDRKLRANIALYHAKYKGVQVVQSSTSFIGLITALTGDPTRASRTASFIIDPGSPLTAKGVELEITAAPVNGITFGADVGYLDAAFSSPQNILPQLLAANGGEFALTSRPKWTGSTFAQYKTQPVFMGGYLSFRLDATFQSRTRLLSNADVVAAYARPVAYQSAFGMLNGRVALSDMSIGTSKAQIALWGKNLNNSRAKGTSTDLRYTAVTSFLSSRAYGLDVTFQY
jgi:iron complex outermembrane receptor protein